MTKREYDAVTCITAGELRSMGCDVPTNIPDCGWVSRDSLRFAVEVPSVERDAVLIRAKITFTEPFTWIEVSGALEA